MKHTDELAEAMLCDLADMEIKALKEDPEYNPFRIAHELLGGKQND